MHKFSSSAAFACVACGLVAPLSGQSIAPESLSYYEGVAYNFIPAPPAVGTFYYNDFNRYELSYTDPAFQRVDVIYHGGAGGNGNDRDYSGVAIIGQDRGTFSGALTSNSLRRVNSGGQPRLHTNNPFDVGRTEPVSGPGLPEGADHLVTTDGRNNSIEFYSENPSALNAHARFSLSTVGRENIRLSLDIAPGLGSSANYRLMISADAGATWSFTQDFLGVTAAEWSTLEFDLSDHPEFADNAAFVFQFVSIPNPEGVWENVGGATSPDGLGVGALWLLLDRVTLGGTPVASGATPVEQWRALHFFSPDATGEAADDFDADGDGLVNLLEYALGGLPRTPDANVAPVVALAGDRLTLAFARIADPALLYEVEAASALAPNSWSVIWDSSGAENIAETVVVPDSVTLGEEPRRFLRLRISFAP